MKTNYPNYRILDSRESKIIQLNILKRFHEICVENSIKYSLAYGTLLGAVRHKGFIPWDDDIDVMMVRSEFNKFLALMTSRYVNDQYKLVSMYNEPSYFSPLPKFYDSDTLLIQDYGQSEKKNYGIYVDVFIVDFLPKNNQEGFYEEAKKIRKKWGYSCRKFFSLKHQSRNLFYDVVGNIISLKYKCHKKNYYRDKYDEHCRKYEMINNDDIAVIEFGESLEKEKMCRCQMENLELIEFESNYFYCIKNKEQYLKNMYGNYLSLPPEKERISKHKNVMFAKIK